ncbi:MAG: M48 family metallopeptidase [Syntrophobacteraceae bacterium]
MKSLEEFGFPYLVKISPRRKTLSITVHPDNRVIVHAPATCARVKIIRFVEQKAEWIRKALQTNLRRQCEAPAKRFETGEVLLYLGKEYTLRIETADTTQVVLEEESICVRMVARELPAQPWKIKELLMRWYGARAMDKIREKTELYAARIGAAPRQVTIKTLKSRWGSCSTTGRISLAWNIIMAPEEVLDYLVVHELCHLVYHDHSVAYWDLVGSILSDHRQRRKWLRENGDRLRL